MDENGGSGNGVVSAKGEKREDAIPTASTPTDYKPESLPYSRSLPEALPLRGPRLSAQDAAQSLEYWHGALQTQKHALIPDVKPW